MPEGLPLDYDAKLNGLISNYAEQVLVCTGQNDWSSRIEEENSGDNLAADLKELLGRGGVYSDGYLLPEKLHPMNDGLPQIHKDRLVRKEAYQHLLPGVRDVDDVLVLICGHGGRDMRCGRMGPVLQAEFEKQLPKAGFEVLQGPVLDESVSAPALSGTDTGGARPPTARVGLISHIGGHKFAGNIIIYLPPTCKNSAGNTHPLAGHGVWQASSPAAVSLAQQSTAGRSDEICFGDQRMFGKPFLCHGNGRTLLRQAQIHPKQAGLRSQVYSPNRALCSSAKLQTKTTLPEPLSSSPSEPCVSSHSRSSTSQSRIPQWILLLSIFASSAGVAYLYRRQSASPDDDVINASTFSAFTITQREQVSPTAFIITLRPSAWVVPQDSQSEPIRGDDDQTGFLSSRIQEAWNHGLWSVEIKQPQLQIARHYTPLPPLPAPLGSEPDEQADLRFLIRRMDSGEMSNYLSRQRVGDTLWLRGPHLGFDVPRRLGSDSGAATTSVDEQRDVVFLAGGTGIAPALQIAHRVLDGTKRNDGEQNRPCVSILWANRSGADTLGREQSLVRKQPSSWFGLWNQKGIDFGPQERSGEDRVSSLALQIQDLKRRHPSHFDISYFVDNEGSFIQARDIKAALTSTTSSTSETNKRLSPPSIIDRNCTWHSQRAVELLPNDNDAERSSSPDFTCTCISAPKTGGETSRASLGVNLVGVSGPDGFIEAYAGAKRWHDGNEMQGALRGLLGRIWNDKGKKLGDWLVLKL
ncbi:hypothetical protein NPX13_g2499 [Xylaria arbuscula]|uniref:FAD-binding FR-type domain-containing protein n=1 Tax=Xylaria arbuscula TaxID=114810 RepID=A0A9W8TQA6_9PEZI|nr:hypothetical protein NPX13_g2499 [Xylaria arbuscula]